MAVTRALAALRAGGDPRRVEHDHAERAGQVRVVEGAEHVGLDEGCP